MCMGLVVLKPLLSGHNSMENKALVLCLKASYRCNPMCTAEIRIIINFDIIVVTISYTGVCVCTCVSPNLYMYYIVIYYIHVCVEEPMYVDSV